MTRAELVSPSVDQEEARETADAYLMDSVGDLLVAGAPRLEGASWIVPIELATARRGRIGEVGTLSVDAVSGVVSFSEQQRAEVEARARALVGTSSP